MAREDEIHNSLGLMPRKSLRPCPGCGTKLTRESYCESCTKKRGWFTPNRGTSHERGYGWAWQKLRRQILNRDNYLCQVCLKKDQLQTATEVDHIIPKAHGGKDTQENLQSICKACHREKTAQEGRGGLNL